MEEIWKDVKGFESLYMVSNLGRVKMFHIMLLENIIDLLLEIILKINCI